MIGVSKLVFVGDFSESGNRFDPNLSALMLSYFAVCCAVGKVNLGECAFLHVGDGSGEDPGFFDGDAFGTRVLNIAKHFEDIASPEPTGRIIQSILHHYREIGDSERVVEYIGTGARIILTNITDPQRVGIVPGLQEESYFILFGVEVPTAWPFIPFDERQEILTEVVDLIQNERVSAGFFDAKPRKPDVSSYAPIDQTMIEAVDLGLCADDVERGNEILRVGLALFEGLPSSPIYREYMNCLVQGILSRLPSISEVYANFKDDIVHEMGGSDDLSPEEELGFAIARAYNSQNDGEDPEDISDRDEAAQDFR